MSHGMVSTKSAIPNIKIQSLTNSLVLPPCAVVSCAKRAVNAVSTAANVSPIAASQASVSSLYHKRKTQCIAKIESFDTQRGGPVQSSWKAFHPI